MKIALRSSPRGIALIIVMVSIIVLAVLAGGFAYSMKVETKLAQNVSCESELEWLGRSGVERARWVLGLQLTVANEPYDFVDQKWGGGPGGLGTANSALADVDLNQPVELGNGRITGIKIVDLERRVNINLASEPVLKQALMLVGADAADFATIVSSIQDWIDRDDATHVSGAESDYYQDSNPPYVAKNGPIDDLAELLLIKGITPEIYWGPASTNHALAAFQAKQQPLFGFQTQPPSANVGLVDLFTPFSSGTINMNTASVEVFQAVLGIDQNIASRIIEFRNQGEGMQEAAPIGSPGKGIREALLYAGFSNQAADQNARFFSVRSRIFEVTVDAELGGYKRQFVAILGRNSPRDIQVLTFYAK